MLKIISPLDQVDSAITPGFAYGSRGIDNKGNEYIYLPGTTSVEKYDACIFTTSSGSVTRMVSTNTLSAQMGVAQGAITSNSAGWFQTYGEGWVQCGTTTSSGSALYSGGTTGTLTGASTTSASILGAIAIGAGTGAANGTIKVRLHYPEARVIIGVL